MGRGQALGAGGFLKNSLGAQVFLGFRWMCLDPCLWLDSTYPRPALGLVLDPPFRSDLGTISGSAPVSAPIYRQNPPPQSKRDPSWIRPWTPSPLSHLGGRMFRGSVSKSRRGTRTFLLRRAAWTRHALRPCTSQQRGGRVESLVAAERADNGIVFH